MSSPPSEVCPAPDSLAAYADGRLRAVESEPIEAHLTRCLACARQLDALTCRSLRELGPIRPSNPGAGPGGPEPETRDAVEAAVLAALEPPQRDGAIGRFAGYDILAVAGRGGMGIVLKAHDPTLHRDVALKVLPPTPAADEAGAERFLREARTIASLRHDHVVTLHAAGREKGCPFLVMPFHADGTLEQRLRRGPALDAAQVARIGLQLARALEATHAHGVLHRDIKPSNVLLDGGIERVRLADFGLAEPVGTAGRRPGRSVAGTPAYMAPEQARGENMDERSDLFGLGALLFHLVTGKTLYGDAEAGATLELAATGERVPVRSVLPVLPKGLPEILEKLLAPRPEDRFGTAAAVAAALEPLVQPRPLPSRALRHAARYLALASLLALAGTLILDSTGRTAVVNSLLCQASGDGYFIRGRFGTQPNLAEAVAAARAHDIIEVRFSHEQPGDPVRQGGKPLTIRAARGFAPVIVATNSVQPILTTDAPLTLEGLVLWRRAPRPAFAPLIAVEKGRLRLLNCRIVRSRSAGQEILVRGRLRGVAVEEPSSGLFHRPLVTFQPGSEGVIENCVIAGTQSAALAVHATPGAPTHLQVLNSLFVTDRTVFMRPDASTRASLAFARSAIVTAGLLELDESSPVSGITLTLDDCVVDRSGGALVRVNQGHGGGLIAALDWRETNVLYAGEGAYVSNRRRRQLDSEALWNEWLRLSPGSHQLVNRPIFSETAVRPALALRADDLNTAALAQIKRGGFGFAPALVGEGRAYDRFRRTAAYRAGRAAGRPEDGPAATPGSAPLPTKARP